MPREVKKDPFDSPKDKEGLGILSDLFTVAFKKESILIAFAQSQPSGKPILIKKIILTPTGLELLGRLAKETIKKYEKDFGERRR